LARRQQVVINGESSDTKFFSAGVHHGSIWEPILFHLSINDIVHDIQCNIKLFMATNITQLKS